VKGDAGFGAQNQFPFQYVRRRRFGTEKQGIIRDQAVEWTCRDSPRFPNQVFGHFGHREGRISNVCRIYRRHIAGLAVRNSRDRSPAASRLLENRKW